MKFSAATVLAVAAGASAHYAKGNVTYTTEVVDVYTTYCPGPTEITHGGKTWTVTEATTLTITDCPCTVTKPLITTSAVVCHTCGGGNGYTNGTTLAPVPTGSHGGKPGSGSGSGSVPSASAPGSGSGSGSNPSAPGGGQGSAVPTAGSPGSPAGTGEIPAGSTPTGAAGTVPTAGAGKIAALSGAGLAGIVGLAAFAL